MRAVVVERHGGPEVLQLTQRASPEPGPVQVLVDIAASGVNYVDVYHRSGAYPTSPPFVPGVEAAGTIAATGPQVTSVAAGDRVAWAMIPGAYAEQAVLDAERVVPVPASVSDELATAVLLQGMTAHYLTHDTYAVRPGDTVLVHAAAGGMGLLLTQLVRLLGGSVIGTVSTAEKERLARQAGADEVIRYTEADVAAEVGRITGGAGVAAVYDGVGADTFDASLASLGRRGVLALYGQASGFVPAFDPRRLNQGSLFLTRPTLADYMVTRDELARRAADVLGWVQEGRLQVTIGGRYPLEEAHRAHADLEARRTTGKLLLLPR